MAAEPSNKKVRLDSANGEIANGNAVVRKRRDYLQWEEYFMAVAFLSAQRSKDPGSQVGACIVSSDNKIVGIGYNGMPNGCSDDLLPWSREASNRLDTKYPYVCHAELNAILNKNSFDVKGCTLYVALFPCNECSKLIIQSGIKRVMYVSDKYHDNEEMVASRKLLDMAGVEYTNIDETTVAANVNVNRIGGAQLSVRRNERDTDGPLLDARAEGRRSNIYLQNVAAGGALGTAGGGLVGGGVGGTIGAIAGGIVGSIVPGPGTALGILVGTGIGTGLGAGVGGGGGLATGSIISAFVNRRRR